MWRVNRDRLAGTTTRRPLPGQSPQAPRGTCCGPSPDEALPLSTLYPLKLKPPRDSTRQMNNPRYLQDREHHEYDHEPQSYRL